MHWLLDKKSLLMKMTEGCQSDRDALYLQREINFNVDL